MKKGFQRVKVDGEFYEIADVPALDKKYKHDIDVVVDRGVGAARYRNPSRRQYRNLPYARDGFGDRRIRDRPLPPEETSAGGSANKSLNETHERVLFSEKFACPVSGFTIPGDRAAGFFLLQQSLRSLHDLRRLAANRRSTRR